MGSQGAAACLGLIWLKLYLCYEDLLLSCIIDYYLPIPLEAMACWNCDFFWLLGRLALVFCSWSTSGVEEAPGTAGNFPGTGPACREAIFTQGSITPAGARTLKRSKWSTCFPPACAVRRRHIILQ